MTTECPKCGSRNIIADGSCKPCGWRPMGRATCSRSSDLAVDFLEGKLRVTEKHLVSARKERDESRKLADESLKTLREIKGKYGLGDRHVMREKNAEIKILKSTLERWLEWARMHGHLDHAAGIADDSRRLISSENAKTEGPAS